MSIFDFSETIEKTKTHKWLEYRKAWKLRRKFDWNLQWSPIIELNFFKVYLHKIFFNIQWLDNDFDIRLNNRKFRHPCDPPPPFKTRPTQKRTFKLKNVCAKFQGNIPNKGHHYQLSDNKLKQTSLIWDIIYAPAFTWKLNAIQMNSTFFYCNGIRSKNRNLR